MTNHSVETILFCDHIRRNIGTCGKEFTPTSAKVLDENTVIVSGTCPEFNNEEDEICVEWIEGAYYWVDFDRCTPIGPTVEQAYDILLNYIGRIAQATSN